MPARSPSTSPSTSRALVVTGLLVVTVVLAGLPVAPSSAAPPPAEVCGVCGDELSTAGPQLGVPLNVEHSIANVTVREDGSGHWYARVWITGSAADRLAANASLRERVVREALADDRTAVDDPRNLRTRVEGSTLVVDFDVPDVAHRSVGGVYLVDFLTAEYHDRNLQIDADTLRIRGPNGTVVTRAPAGATVETDSVVWNPAGRNYGLDGDARLAFAGTDGPLANVATTFAITADGVAFAGPAVLVVGGVPAVVLGCILWLLRTGRGPLPGYDPTVLAQGITTLAAAVAALGLLAVLWPTIAGTSVVLGGPILVTVVVFSALYGLVAAAPLVLDGRSAVRSGGRSGDRSGDRSGGRSGDLSIGLLAAWSVGAGILVALVAATASADALGAALLSIPTALFLPLGRAHGKRGPLTAALAAGLLLAPLGAAVVLFPAGGLLSVVFLTAGIALPWAFATALFGLPLYVLGTGLGDGVDDRPRPPSTPSPVDERSS